MKNSIKLIIALISVLFNGLGYSQTLYLPSGTGGISAVTNSTSNVGVGLSTPQAAFHIYTPSSTPFYLQRDNSTQGNIWAFRVTSADATYGINPRSLYIHQGQYDADIAFGTRNAAPDFIIKKNGYVGIGNTTPNDKLDIRGKLRLTSIRTSDSRDHGLIFSTYGVENTLYEDIWPDKHERAFIIQAEGYVDGSNAGGSGIQLWTKDITGPRQALVIRRDGKVGIGTVSPAQKLHVSGTERVGIQIGGPSTSIGVIADLYFKTNDNQAVGGTTFWNWCFRNDSWGSAPGDLVLYSSNGTYTSPIIVQADGDLLLTTGNNSARNGNVGIGTTTPAYKLSVNGIIGAKEVKVTSTGWSDFVFEPDYDLPSLREVENYIDQNGHLPDIPSAEKVKADGISLGEMDAKLLQKIEELTLYTLEQEKKLETLVEANKKLKAESQKQKAQQNELATQKEKIAKLEKMVELLMSKSE